MPRPDPYLSAIWSEGHTWSYADDHTVSAKLGFRVSFSTPGTIAGVMYLRHPLDHGAHIGYVHETTGGPPITWSMQPPPQELSEPEYASWHKLYLHPRFRPVVDVEYEVGVWFEAARYGYESHALDAAIDVGPIHLPANIVDGNGNGVFEYGGPSLPLSSTFNATLYGVDVLYLEDVG